MKNIKSLYEPYIPKIIRQDQGFRYNLSEENIFGNLNYSMNKNLLRGKTIEFNSLLNGGSSLKPPKLIPIIRYKPSWVDII